MIRVVVAFSVLLLGACSSRSAELFVTSPEWDAWGGGGLEKELSSAARAQGYTLKVTVIPALAQAGGGLTRALTRTRPPVIIASPLLSRETLDAASRTPGAPVILIGGAESGTDSGVVRVVFDRREAFRTMGWVTGLSLKESGGKVGILLPRTHWGGSTDIEAFTQGLSEGGYTEAPLERELPEPLDKAVVQKAVTEMRAQGVEVFLPRLGELNGSCMEALKISGGSADTEDWRASGAYKDQVFLSVEENVAAGVGLGLASIGGEAKTVSGPVTVVCGNARAVPAVAAGRVSCN